MGLKLVTGPDIEPVTLEIAKAHLKVDHDADDELIREQALAARQWIETYTRRALISQTWALTLADFPRRHPFEILLPLGQVIAVNSISYTDEDGAAQTLTGPTSGSPAGTGYQEDLTSGSECRLRPPVGGEWPGVQAEAIQPVSISFTAGTGPMQQMCRKTS